MFGGLSSSSTAVQSKSRAPTGLARHLPYLCRLLAWRQAVNSRKVLAIDDSPDFLSAIQLVLRDEYEVLTAESGETGLRLMESQPVNTVILDLHMPSNAEGLEILKRILDAYPHLPVVMMTAAPDLKYAVQAIKIGAHDYLHKDADRDRIITTVRNAVDRERLERERRTAAEQARSQFPLVGSGSATTELKQLALKAAGQQQPILITGETGVGKDVVARYIHYASERANAAFVKINMASVPEDLVESELFGHKKGSFTGAIADKKGLFAVADGGTLFLDEIGLASTRMQEKLLQAIDDGTFTLIGDVKPVKVNVRIISATNRDLWQEAQAGRFREDLFWRLNGFPVPIRPLRERPEDLLEIAEHFLEQSAAELSLERRELTVTARKALLEYRWPGNVRELKSVIGRTLVFSDSREIEADDIRRHIQSVRHDKTSHTDHSLKTNLENWEREHICAILLACDYDIPMAASMLGIHRVTLYKKMRELGLELKRV
ncbi:Fis family transcriptional regulator [candidate division GN15 bacterium]|uniref:Fis family transcriptional regulator n=1 Tax=candidate division GN15 bacterium TaxID=2072418 RepID=A0A855WVG8_9BACT|nr:MAG: Fis family transcriptional regulator [candidate division GN15 bacterium]